MSWVWVKVKVQGGFGWAACWGEGAHRKTLRIARRNPTWKSWWREGDHGASASCTNATVISESGQNWPESIVAGDSVPSLSSSRSEQPVDKGGDGGAGGAS